ncbi:phage terminase large subunit [Kitasatospora aureofaciens]|uniref:phage terminase large subunit n=1 Tax=Kitasatospora aureofaciens TaxID=1894 RepID=UPI0033FA89E6
MRANAFAILADQLEDVAGGLPVFPTPGDLAAAIDPRTVATPALNLLDDTLVAVTDNKIRRLIWSMPPQEGKSQRVSRTFPAWLLARRPDLRIAIASYELGTARRWGRAIRNDLAEHEDKLGLKVRQDTSAAHEWQLDGHHGGVYSVGIGGALTGRPVDVLIIDDPIKGRAEAESEVYRQRCWDWWTDVARTRLAPNAVVIIVLTRWHEDDLAGRLLSGPSAHEWTYINIPAEADGDQDPLGRAPGQYLTSARGRTSRDWEDTKRDVGSRTWTALYQGRPAPAEGGMVKRSWWRYYDAPRAERQPDGTMLVPGSAQVIQSWDMTFKDSKSSDYVVGQVWAKADGQAFLLDQVRDRLDFPAACRAVQALSAKWPQTSLKLVEDKANGPAVIAQLQSTVPGLVAVTPQGSKEARLAAVTPFIEAGNVLLPAPHLAPWVDEFIAEHSVFPNGVHDDQVDAASQALARLMVIQAARFHFPADPVETPGLAPDATGRHDQERLHVPMIGGFPIAAGGDPWAF